MNLVSLLGGWLDPILNFGQTLVMYILEALKLIFVPIYFIFMGVCWLISFSENVFKAVSGIDKIYLNGNALGGGAGDGKDLVYAFITDVSVQNVFWSILALSLLLLFIFTIVAMIKSEFTIDLKGSAKGPIIGRALKSLVNFLVIPVTTLISVMGVNFLSKTIYDLFGNGDNTFVSKCFYVGAYNANRARRDTEFIMLLNDPDFVESNPFGSGNNQQVAYAIDESFTDFKMWNFKAKKVPAFGDGCKAELEDEKGYTDWHTLILGIPETSSNKTYSIWNPKQVNYFYNLVYFDYILAVGSAIVLAWTLLSVCLVLVKRVFELTILFLLAPPMIAIAPLDGGQAEKKWRGEFMKRLLSVLGTVFSYNMYFLFVPLFENISLFGNVSMSFNASAGAVAGGAAMLGSYKIAITDFLFVFDIFFQLICVIVGAGIIKSASALISTLLGVEDLVKSGGEAAKKAVDVGKKAMLGATAIGGVAIKGGAMLAKGVGRAGKAIGNSGLVRSAKAKLKGIGAGAKAGLGVVGKKVGGVASKVGGAIGNKVGGIASKVGGAIKNNKHVQAATNWLSGVGDTVGGWAHDVGDTVGGWVDTAKGWAEDAGSAVSGWAENAGNTVKGWAQSAGSWVGSTWVGKAGKAVGRFGKKVGSGVAGVARDVSDAAGAASQSHFEEAKNIEKEGDMFGFKGVREAFRSAKDEEYGQYAQDKSFGAKLTQHKFFKNTLFGRSMAEWLNPKEGSDAYSKRRLNDALSGLFGDGGGGDLWKIWFNKNARAGLYEGVPESKQRSAKIEASMTMAGREEFTRKEKEKAEAKSEHDLIKRYLAQRSGNSDYEKYVRQLETETSPTVIKDLHARIERLDKELDLDQQATTFQKGLKADSENARQLSAFKDQIRADADAAERAEMEKIKQENQAQAAGVVAGGGGGTPEVKSEIDTASIKNLGKEFADQLYQKGTKTTVSGPVQIKGDAFEGLTRGFDSLSSMLKEVASALQKMSEDNKGKK